MSAELKRHEQTMLRFAGTHDQSSCRTPTLGQIGQAVGVKSKDHVSRGVKRLDVNGYIRRTPRVSREIEILFTVEGRSCCRNARQVPLWGTIAAGEPIPVPDDKARTQDQICALRGQGNSLTDALISDADIVLRRHQEATPDGDRQMLAVWLRDTGETTLKKVYHEGECIRLQPANPEVKALCVSPERIQIQGKLIGLRRQMG